jgi:two-component system, LuxR family, sensor kinase FixL
MSAAPPVDKYLPETAAAWTELLQQLPGFVMITAGPNHVVAFCNASLRELTRYRDLEGRALADALPELADQGFVAIRDQVYRSGKAYRGRAQPFKIRNGADGPYEEGYIDFIYQPIKRQDGTVTGIIFAGYDITEQKQAVDRVKTLQAELFHVSKTSAMNAMAMTMAHELNQPLAAISNYAAAARKYLGGGQASDLAKAHAAMDNIEAASRRAGDIIRAARDAFGKARPENKRFEMAPLIEEAMGLALLDPAREGIKCESSLAPGLFVKGDRVQLLQVMLNLLRNAVDAMAGCDRRELEIIAEKKGDSAEVRVSDTGIGLADEVRQRMFDPFVTTKPKGLGIGLSISRSIVEAHGGELWADDREGGGTDFCLKLPLAR